MAKVLSRDRALSFPFTSFICSILSTLQFVIKKIIYAYVKYACEAPKNGPKDLTIKESGVRPVMWCQAYCLTPHSSCKASLFTIWNLSLVVILKMNVAVFCFWKLILSSIILCCSFFWIWKFCAPSVVLNFCQTLNGSTVKIHLSPFEMLQNSQFWS